MREVSLRVICHTFPIPGKACLITWGEIILKKILNLKINDIKLNKTDKIEKYDNKNLWSKSYNSLKKIKNYNYYNFYNDDLKKLVYNIYEDDFIFFKDSLKIDYNI